MVETADPAGITRLWVRRFLSSYGVWGRHHERLRLMVGFIPPVGDVGKLFTRLCTTVDNRVSYPHLARLGGQWLRGIKRG